MDKLYGVCLPFISGTWFRLNKLPRNIPTVPTLRYLPYLTRGMFKILRHLCITARLFSFSFSFFFFFGS